jgi:hypothetical protein
MAILSLKSHDATVLIPAAQTVTAAWVNIGDVMNLSGVEAINLWAKIDINDSTSVQFRVVGKLTPGASDVYVLPLATASATTVDLDDDEKVVQDTDHNSIVPFSLGGGISFGQIQVKAGVLGATAAIVTAAHVTIGNN